MFKVMLKILHVGCWGSDIGLKFPTLKLSSIDSRWIKGKVAHILHASGDSKLFNEVIKYLKKRKDVTKMEVLSRSKEDIYIRTITEHGVDYDQFSNIFFQNNCFPISPTRFEEKYEVWTLGTAEKKNFAKIYKHLKGKHEFKTEYLKRENIEAKLTQKQREILMHAKHLGYYEWPRKISATKICKILKIPKTVFLSHLRKAEIRIIKNFIENRP